MTWQLKKRPPYLNSMAGLGPAMSNKKLSGALHGMRAKLGRNLIDGTFPRRMIGSAQSESRQCVLRRAAVAENPRALLPADGNGLMPLNRTEVVRNRRGHGATPH
jgi:hypothetical protein